MISDFGKLTSFERGTLLTKLLICLILVNVVVWGFLMHRVELKVKALAKDVKASFRTLVPNAPCGVESYLIDARIDKNIYNVPNAPCGVERSIP